jgi:alkanesulfonate monooxygenase SsuD/methylene tetrahydromethanopterin reductase-like flavin-dependent oxidoreductase (luciferase family)
MHFGLFSLMAQRDRAVTARRLYEETVEQVKLAEAIGFDIAWFAEHHFSNYCLCPSPITMATCLAPQTSRIRLGTAVVVAPLYHPLRMLEDLGMLDVVSNGRAVIGVGTGYQQYEFHRFGVALEAARDTFLETLDVLEQYLSGGPVHYAGKHIRIPETHFVVHPIQRRPEVYVAGLARDPVTQARVVANCYVPIFTTGWSSIEQMRETRAVVTAANPAAGGDAARAPYAMQRYVFVTDDKAEALRAAEAARYIRRVAMSMRNNVARLDGAFLQEMPAPDEPPLEEIANRLVVGDAETCAAKLAAEIEALQPVHISCFMGLPDMPQARTLRSMERFGAEVMPMLERHFGGLAHIGRPAQ